MNLLDTMRDLCVMMDKSTAADGMGGFIPTWSEGAQFYAVIRKDRSPEEVVAQQQGAAETFTVIVDKSVSLDYHDVFKRKSDGAVFRMTSETRDGKAPAWSTVPIAKATCERWELP